jgi:hypothetical protein
MDKKAAIDKLWRMGNLMWKLKGVQKDMRQAVETSKGKRTVFLCSRRLGKTFVMMLLAIEYCLKHPNAIVKVLFPKKKDAKAVARDQMKVLLADCPKDLLPEWKEADKLYIFPNGAEIQMAGTDGGSAESVRGSACHLAILDEAGFHDYNDFSYIVQSIIMPTLLTTRGKMILASTPSKEPDHPFMTDYVLPSRRDGTLIEYDIYANPMITPDMIEEIAEEFPLGVEDPNFQREFMLRSDIVSDDNVIPEFTVDLERDIVQVSEKPPYYDAYVSGDPAVTDLTVILFAYYDYLQGKIVVEDELVLGGTGDDITTQDIADGIVRKEKMHFTNKLTGEQKKPYLRVMDNNFKILINDLFMDHGLNFIPTAKDNKEAQVNKLRMLLNKGRIEINPKCKNLLHHMRNARWKRTKSTGMINGFSRNKGNREKNIKANHCDALDALLYLIRNVDLKKNPYPDDFFEMKGDSVFRSTTIVSEKEKKIKDIMKDIMNIKK